MPSNKIENPAAAETPNEVFESEVPADESGLAGKSALRSGLGAGMNAMGAGVNVMKGIRAPVKVPTVRAILWLRVTSRIA